MKLPEIGYGTWEVPKDQAYELTKAAIKNGYKHIDTANIYGNEKEIGQAIIDSKKRKSIFITSKIWPFDYKNNTYESVKKTVERMGLTKIDLILLHAPYNAKNNIIAYKDLMKARKDGLAEHIGVSNFTIDNLKEIKEATGEYPYANQIILSPTTRLENIGKFCKENNIILVGYSILRSYFSQNPLYKKSGMTLEQKAIVDNMSKKYKKDVGQLLSKWALQIGYSVIPKSTKIKRIESNIKINDFEIEKKDIDTLNSWNHMNDMNFKKILKKFKLFIVVSILFKKQFKKSRNLY